MISYELAKQLKESGFPQGKSIELYGRHRFMGVEHSLCPRYSEDYYDAIDMVDAPSLSELIEACGDRFESLIKQAGGWVAIANTEGYMMKQKFSAVSTPEEAVARLWLALNEK